MATLLHPGEESQLGQTIEMFEVITQSQPDDYQSLEILKEAYVKVGRERDAVNTSKRIAQAYVAVGQLSSAILEYETILQRHPDDPDVQRALARIESQATSFPVENAAATLNRPAPDRPAPKITGEDTVMVSVDDGRRAMHKVFVEGRIITQADFDQCWTTPSMNVSDVSEPFIEVLASKGMLPIENALKILSDKSRAAYVPLMTYDVDMDLARKFPRQLCCRWCVMPFDRMSKSIFVATANPFNHQAANELAEATSSRLLWYLAPPADLMKLLRRVFR